MVINFKCVARVITYCVLLVIILSGLCVIAIVQDKPWVTPATRSATEDIVPGTELLRRTVRMLTQTGAIQNYVASVEEINSVMILANKRFNTFWGEASVSGSALRLSGTLKLPLGNSFYINAYSSVPQGSVFVWQDSKVGHLPIPDLIANLLFKQIGARFVQAHFSDWVEQGVRAVSIRGQQISIQAVLPEGLSVQMQNTIGLLGGISNEEQIAISNLAHFYLNSLERYSSISGLEEESFSACLNILSEAILFRTKTEKVNFKDELTAAIFALAYAMEPSLISPFLPKLHHSFRLPDVKLDGRQDFAKHFILSAVLEILSNKEVAFTVGELKELTDSNGGSGFSLKDIAADRAGVYFIRALSTKEAVARRFVSPRYTLSDIDYFPSVTGFQEGLTETEFKEKFSSTESIEYSLLIRKIDGLIGVLPLYGR